MRAARWILPLARVYAEQAGLPLSDEAILAGLEARLSRMPRGAREASALAALLVRWVAPSLLMGRPRRLESLIPAQKDAILCRLQRSGPALRGVFLGAKSLAAGAAYGSPAFLSRLGYERPTPPSLPRPALARGPTTSTYDFVVVGSGAGGCAVAGRLAEAGASVLLVERGRRPQPHADAFEAVHRYYARAALQAATGNCLLPIPTGTAVGGTTAINSGTCFRPPEGLETRWEGAAPGTFDPGSFRSYVEQAWERLRVRRAPEATVSPSTRLFLSGLKRLATRGAHLLDRAEDGCEGSGRCCFVCPTGGKVTADRAFLEPLGADSGLELAEGTELVGLVPPGSPSHGPGSPGGKVLARLRPPGGPVLEVGARAVVLACGALETPYHVRRYALGPGWRRAGDDLSVHPAAEVLAAFAEPVRGWRGVPQGLGLLDPEETRLRYEGAFLPPEMAAAALPLEGERLRWWMERYDRVAAFGFMVRDFSRGRVRYPFGPSLPVLRYRLEEADRRVFARGMRFAAEVFLAAGAVRVLLPYNGEGNEATSREDLERPAADPDASRLQMMAFHPLGTCGMGRVTDSDLRLCEGVYVGDGSVVPDSLGVNPQVTIAAFGLRLADHLLGRSYAR